MLQGTCRHRQQNPGLCLESISTELSSAHYHTTRRPEQTLLSHNTAGAEFVGQSRLPASLVLNLHDAA